MYRMARRLSTAEVSGKLGKPRLGWMDGMKAALSSEG